MFIYPCHRRLITDKNVDNPIIISMLSRIKRFCKFLWPKLRTVFSTLLEIIKFAALGSIIFIVVPFLYEFTGVQARLDANIYDFYGIIILIYLACRVHVLEELVKRIKTPERVYLNVEDDELDDEEWFKID